MPQAAAKKLLRDQLFLEVKGGGIVFDGFYAELQPSIFHEVSNPIFRRIRANGEWAPMFLLFDRSAERWCFANAPWETPTPRICSSRCMCSNPCEAVGWQCSDGSPSGLTIQDRVLRDLPTKARTLAKDTFKEPRRFTRFTCKAENCPKECNNPIASSWGLASEAELYGHLCLYHRNAPQYYEKYRQYWDQSVANALNERSEEQEDLLTSFEKLMCSHRYESKTVSHKVKDHCSNIRRIVTQLNVPLSRQLALDSSVYEQLSQWPEEISSHGHFSTSLRWFKKWVEIYVVEEVLANSMDVDDVSDPIVSPRQNAQPMPCETCTDCITTNAPSDEVVQKVVDLVGEVIGRPVAAASAGPSTSRSGTSRSHQSQVDQESSAKPEPKRHVVGDLPAAKRPRLELGSVHCVRKVAVAADPYMAVLQMQDHVPCPGAPRNPRTGSSSAGGGHAPSASAPEAAPLAKDFGRVASGDRSVAEKYSTWEESEGPCCNALGEISGKERRKVLESLSDQDVEHAWLWAYCGVRPRTAVLTGLSLLLLPPACSDNDGLLCLLVKILCVAHSPHAMPMDVLFAVDVVLDAPYEAEKMVWNKLTVLAKAGFVPGAQMLNCLTDSECPRLLRIAVFGGFLGKELRRWPESFDSIGTWWEQFSRCTREVSISRWYYRASFASGLLWNFDDCSALDRLSALNNRGIPDFWNLQLQALKRAQERAAKAGRQSVSGFPATVTAAAATATAATTATGTGTATAAATAAAAATATARATATDAPSVCSAPVQEIVARVPALPKEGEAPSSQSSSIKAEVTKVEGANCGSDEKRALTEEQRARIEQTAARLWRSAGCVRRAVAKSLGALQVKMCLDLWPHQCLLSLRKRCRPQAAQWKVARSHTYPFANLSSVLSAPCRGPSDCEATTGQVAASTYASATTPEKLMSSSGRRLRTLSGDTKHCIKGRSCV